MKRTLGFFILFVLFQVAPALAAGNWYFGGGVGIAFGGNVDNIIVEPIIGYRATRKLHFGTRFIWRYREDRRFEDTLTTNDYGAAAFTRYFTTKHIFVQGEYEYIDYEFARLDGSTDRDSYGSLLAGVGWSQPLGPHTSFGVIGLYNFTYSDDDPGPYAEPWVIRAGFGFFF